MTLLKKTKNYKYTSSNLFLHPALPLPDIFCEILFKQQEIFRPIWMMETDFILGNMFF